MRSAPGADPGQVWAGGRVPVTLLAGYLGAGKTTVVNQLLASTERRLAILVNDVGQIAVDAELLSRRTDGVIELTNGCVCCSLAGGFVDALEEIRNRPRPDHVVIELSGVAEPARIVPWASTAGFRLDGVMTLVDVDQIADRHGHPRTRDTVERQISASDVVLRTKIDLASPADASAADELIARLAPSAPVVDVVDGIIDEALLLGVYRSHAVAETAHPVPNPHRVEVVDRPFEDRDGLDRWLAQRSPEVVRIKGAVRCADGSLWRVDVVGARQRVVTDERPESNGLVVISVG